MKLFLFLYVKFDVLKWYSTFCNIGDSGGGLILLENGKFTLVGITSAGFGCGVHLQPGIYHNVQKTAKWIQSVIKRDLY